MNDRAKDRLANATSSTSEVKTKKNNVAYKTTSQLPNNDEVRKLRIYVDRTAEAVVLPIYGIPVPFHISMIKNVSVTVEGTSPSCPSSTCCR